MSQASKHVTILPCEIEQGEGPEQLLRKLFEMSFDLLAIVGADGYFKMVNPSFDRLGYSSEELLSRPLLDFVHPEDRVATLEESAKLANGAPTIRFENRYRCKDGSYLQLAWTSTPDRDGRHYAVGRDVTEERRLERELRQAKNRSETAAQDFEALTYSVSHDLRAPLRAIDGFSRALLEDYGDKVDSEGKSHLERLRTAAKKMGQLINGLLSVSRVSRGEFTKTRVDLSAIARSVADKTQEKEPERNVVFLIPEGLAAVTDARLMTVVLEHLIQNAWKFTRHKTGAEIEIGMSEDAETWAFSVRDNGVGFDMAQVHKLFSPFQRLHAENEFEGIGIGLTIVRRIVIHLGGQVSAESKVGEGTVIRFALPRQPA